MLQKATSTDYSIPKISTNYQEQSMRELTRAFVHTDPPAHLLK